ncbi:MAG: aldose 1-epimerase family protein [Nocardioides sp.]
MVAPTGEQYEIKAAGYAATITESGATLRLLTKDGRNVVDGFPEEEIPGACRGQLLMPWPNRIRDGRYTFEGQEHQLGLTEPHTHNAIHGLVRWATWHVVEHTEARIELGLRLMAQNGYPWTLELGVVYELGEDGLKVTQKATNHAATNAPFATGAHPYFTLDTGGTIDAWTLDSPAATRVLADDRLLPTGTESVEGTVYDFRGGKSLDGIGMDTCFADLEFDADGIATVTLSTVTAEGEERAVDLWQDSQHRWLMVYTADNRNPARTAIAIEPMTASVDAFNSGEGLIVLAPGETFSGVWGIRAR